MAEDARTNSSLLGRLLEEISWEGNRVRLYRRGGLGMENVLTTEVLSPLSYLPRQHFLGEVLRSAHGAEAAMAAVITEIEDAEIFILPPELTLQPGALNVQPDAVIESTGVYVLVEAKRIRRASFQPEQLAREYLTVLREAGDRVPALLLILGAPPPVTVKQHGLRDIRDAISERLPWLLTRTGADEDVEELVEQIPQVVSWITWAEIDEIVRRQVAGFEVDDPSVRHSVERLAAALSSAIQVHS
ncbi:hypothetical protein [Humibacillus xanthopallidus]|uniref:hypothetical protein n=1 Tax=Humibacillus xanthopallidus TaxID=412689 RepID=UPI00384CDF4A